MLIALQSALITPSLGAKGTYGAISHFKDTLELTLFLDIITYFLYLETGVKSKAKSLRGISPRNATVRHRSRLHRFRQALALDILVDAFLFPCRRRAIQVIVFSPCALIEGKSLWHPGWFFYIIPPEGKSGFSNSRGALTQPL